jgi:hypothetical protein
MCADLKSLAMGAAQIWRQNTHALDVPQPLHAKACVHLRRLEPQGRGHGASLKRPTCPLVTRPEISSGSLVDLEL